VSEEDVVTTEVPVVSAPLCPHGCFKRKPMDWVDDQWRCPKCGAEWDDEALTGTAEIPPEQEQGYVLELAAMLVRMDEGTRSFKQCLKDLRTAVTFWEASQHE